MLRKAVAIITILASVAAVNAQAPVSQATPLVPVDPSAATPALATPALATPIAASPGDAMTGAFDSGAVDPDAPSLEAVRQAIARQDYPAAQAALDVAKRSSPNHSSIPLYESLIQRGQAQGPVLNTSPAEPASVANPTPAAAQPSLTTPEAEPEPESEPAAASDSLTDKAKELWENEMVRYGVYGALGLIALLVIFTLIKKRRNRADESPYASDDDRQVSTGAMAMGGLDDHLADGEQPIDFATFNPSDAGSGAGQSSPSAGADLSAADNSAGAGDAIGGSGMSGGMEGYTVPTFDHDDEDEEPAPPPRPAPVKPVDDDAMINIFGDDDPAPADQTPPAPVEVPAPTPTPAPAPAPAEPDAPSESVSFGSMSLESPAPESTPSEPALAPYSDEETVILSAPDLEPLQPDTGRNATPTSTPSLSTGTVDLEDIFGSQPLPGQDETPPPVEPDTTLRPAASDDGLATPSDAALSSAALSEPAAEDPNSMTLPTFVSSPDVENPEQDSETPPPNNQRPKPEEGSDTQSISFEELFGAPEESSVPQPSGEQAEQPEEPSLPEPPPPAAPASEDAVEDALAAALSAMAAESPDDAPAPATDAPEESPVQSSESLDDRTERMFKDQMKKARHAVNEKNWRQAVHVLSIASALHPENEEAKQMLKDARGEKRKSEESV